MATPTLREQILAELDQVPDEALAEILTYIQVRNAAVASENSVIWQAYLKSEKEREEVYRRLANS